MTGQNTHFDKTSVLTFSSADIQVGQVNVNSATEIVAALTIAGTAAAAKSSITVTTGTEVANGPDLFSILPKPVILVPSTAAQGTNLAAITITGGPGGYSAQNQADLGEGILIGSVTSPDSGKLVLNNVSIANDAPVGPRILTLTLGSGDQSFPNAFTVTPGANTHVVSIEPNHGDRGHPGLPVTITAQNARFDRIDPKLSFPSGYITAGSITVIDKDHLTTTLAIAGNATEGPTDVVVSLCSTYGSVEFCSNLDFSNGFSITTPGTLDSADPAIIKAGETVAVAFAATDGNFVDGQTALILQPSAGLTVTSLTVVDSEHLSAQIQADTKPTSGPRNVIALTGTEVAIGNKLLYLYSPQIQSVVPAGAYLGTPLVLVRITGADIPFDANTQVSFSGTGVTVSGVTFNSSTPNQVVAKVTVAATAAVGSRDLIVNAGALEVTDPKAFAVLKESENTTGKGGCSCGQAGSIPLLLMMLLLPLGLRRRSPPTRPS